MKFFFAAIGFGLVEQIAAIRLGKTEQVLDETLLVQTGAEAEAEFMNELIDALLKRPKPPPVRDINEGPNINIVDNGKQHINPGNQRCGPPKVKINIVPREQQWAMRGLGYQFNEQQPQDSQALPQLSVTEFGEGGMP